MNVLDASGAQEEGSDALTGKNNSKLKFTKSRLYAKIKRKEHDGSLKQSQSESDIACGVEDVGFSKGMPGSRALSYNSIFLAEQSDADPEPLRVLSHENLLSKVQALQTKIQQQKMHLGPPVRLPKRHPEDSCGTSEDDGLPRSPPEVSHDGLSMRALNQDSSPLPISPAAQPFQAPFGVDFSTPPHLTSILDNSAARHRMSIKPKNQRASIKNKRVITSVGSRQRSESWNNLEHSRIESKDEEERKELPRARSYSSQVLRPGDKLSASPSITVQEAVDSRLALAEIDNKKTSTSESPPKPKDLINSNPPVSFMAQQTTKAKSDGEAKSSSLMLSVDRKEQTINEDSKSFRTLTRINLDSPASQGLRSSETTTQDPITTLTKSCEVEVQSKPEVVSRSGVQNAGNMEKSDCLLKVLPSETANVICGVTLRPSSLRRNSRSTIEKPESRILLPATVSGPTPEDTIQVDFTKRQTGSSDNHQEKPRTSGAVREVRDSNQLEKNIKDNKSQTESQKEIKVSANPVTIISSGQINRRKETEEDNGLVEETSEDLRTNAEENNEREAANAFGVKLRSTSLSLKFRFDSDRQTERRSDEARSMFQPTKLQTQVSSEDQQTDENPQSCSTSKNVGKETERPGLVRHDESLRLLSSPRKTTKVEPTLANKEADLPSKPVTTAAPSQESAPNSSSPEVSWMDMAREKTRSLQQLFTSRLSEFPSLNSALRPSNPSSTQPQSQASTPQTDTILTSSQQTNLLQKSAVMTPKLPAQPSEPFSLTTTESSPMLTRTSTKPPESLREIQLSSKTQQIKSHTDYIAKHPPHTPPQMSSPQHAGPPQTLSHSLPRSSPPSGSLHLSSRSTLTSHAVNAVSMDSSQNDGGLLRKISGKADQVLEAEGKENVLEDSRPVWASGLGNKNSLVQHWDNQTSAATKTSDQKNMQDPVSTDQSTGSLKLIQVRTADREDTSMTPSASQPVRDTAQPSWMELAKRKSLAWSDKTMD